MGATDVNDQLAANYRPRLKTKSWIPRIFSHFLNHATVNMFVIAKFIRNIPNQLQQVKDIIPAGHLNFRLTLVDALTKPYILQRVLQEAPVTLQSKNKKQWETDFSRLSGAHFPVQEHTKDDQRFEGKKRPRNEGSNVRNWVRGYCKICNKFIPTSCESCKVFLCIGNDSNTMTCWKRFHTCRKITDLETPVAEESENDWEDVDDDSEVFI